MYPATIVRADPTHGVVLLQAVGAQGLTPLTFATVQPRVGDLAIAVAHAPFSPVTLATGTVSSVGITVTLGDTEPPLRDVLTVDATPDPRQDGAPLLDGNGDVIGVVVDAGSAAPGVVALSMTAAANLVSAATGGGSSTPEPALGVQSEIIDPATAAAAGVPVGALILSVTTGGPAAAAGLLPGDVVTAVGQHAARRRSPARSHRARARARRAGDPHRVPGRQVADRPADRGKQLVRPRRHTETSWN